MSRLSRWLPPSVSRPSAAPPQVSQLIARVSGQGPCSSGSGAGAEEPGTGSHSTSARR
jgi:hypothetical protein